ncbi:MAG: serine hydrolase domain-containing protein [Flavobacteriaceae bacterium]
MRRFILGIGFTIMFLSCSETEEIIAVNGIKSDILQINQIDTIYKKAKFFPNEAQMAFALIKNGEISYFGIKRTNDTLITVENKDKAFEIGSISKVFTATLLSNFIIDKELLPDDKINTFFDYSFNDNLEFTFEELANHTSGLPRMPSNIHLSAMLSPKNPYKNYDEKKFEKYLKESISLEYSKGEKSEYSNLGAGLLSYTLRKYSRKSYEELLKEKIFSKYQMTNSTTERSRISDILIGGFDEKGRKTSNWDSGVLIGAGGIYSTTEDLAKFALAQFDESNAELAFTRQKTFQENDFRDVGLGWFIINRKDGNKWYWHNGGTGGYTSSMAIDIKNKNGVIILTNISSYHEKFAFIDQLCFSLMNTLYIH